MSTQTLTADGVAAAADTFITSAQSKVVKLTLLTVGQGSDHAEGDEIRFTATGGSPIEVVDSVGKRVGFVPGDGAALVVALKNGDPGEWQFSVSPQKTPGAFDAAAPAGGTGATAGAYDTAANRDALIDLVNNMRTILIDHGLMKAE